MPNGYEGSRVKSSPAEVTAVSGEGAAGVSLVVGGYVCGGVVMSATSNGVAGKAPGATPSPASYHYTSSTSLLTAAASKPVPPPTLPKYTSGSPATYRLAGLERLANRQRLFEQPDAAPAVSLLVFYI